jgi:polynucleotide 5'-hydroxyl-kinase GRC3/NOL9
MALQIHEEWIPHIREILSAPGVTVVVGATDSGKTSFSAMLANSAVRAGVPAAVVDADMGQSEIGPPTAISMGLVDNEIQSLSDIVQRKLFFVGYTSPVNHFAPAIVGTKKMVDAAVQSGRTLVIVDTTGFVRGNLARRLKTYKLQMLEPRHIVALQRKGEAEHFLRLFDTWAGCSVHRLPVAERAHIKPRPLRTQRRAVKFYEYFRESREHTFLFQKTATSGTMLGTGIPLLPKYLKFAERSLASDVLYGEAVDGGIYLVLSGGYNKQGIAELYEHFRTKNINIVASADYANLVVGLTDENLETLALGIIQKIDFRAGAVSVITPLKSADPVRSIAFGELKIREDGTEIGRLPAGEF